jgi:transcriptional regulator with XRE-family HTH domain
MGNRRSKLAERRRALGLTQEALAARCDVERTTVARWETGFMEPGLWIRARLAEALEVTLKDLDALLTLEPGKEATVVEVLPDSQERNQARLLLGQLASVVMAPEQGADPAWAEPVDRLIAPGPARIGMVDVEHVQALTAAMRAVDYAHGGGACRDAIAAQVRWSQQLLLADASDETRRGLLVALADLHNLAGWTSFDVGMYSTARRHFSRALEQAQVAGHRSLAANVLNRLGRLHLHRGMYQEGLRFFQLGQITAQDSGCSVTVAILCANEAWAYALVGDRAQMNRSLARANNELEHADRENAEEWVRFFDQDELHAVTGVTLAALPDATGNELDAAIEHMTAASERTTQMTRSRVLILPNLARAHIRAGNTDYGVRIGHEAVDGALTVRSVRPTDRLVEMVDDVATLNGDDAEDLHHRIQMIAA